MLSSYGKVLRGSWLPPEWHNPALLSLDAVAGGQGLLRQLGGGLLSGQPMRGGIAVECGSFPVRQVQVLGSWRFGHRLSFRVTQKFGKRRACVTGLPLAIP